MEFFTESGIKFISYDLAENGSIFDFINQGGHLPLPIAKYYTVQLIQSIIAMHSAGVCHRGLKLESLVLDSKYNLKVTDFGNACPIQGENDSGFCTKVSGTPSYMAPE